MRSSIGIVISFRNSPPTTYILSVATVMIFLKSKQRYFNSESKKKKADTHIVIALIDNNFATIALSCIKPRTISIATETIKKSSQIMTLLFAENRCFALKTTLSSSP